MTRLTCLMPTYNKETTLAKAIESVMMQKADFDYKLIILDDYSQDNSYKIAQEYKKKYPSKIEIVRNKENLGLLRSIMNGYTLLKGSDYFCVLDADDCYTSNEKFFEAVNFLNKHPKYSMYMTNIVVKKSDCEELWYKGQVERLDFSFKDRFKDNVIIIQTSGVVYRNLYFKSGKNKQFEKILKFKFPESYRADGFRFEWYLQGGKAHFENKVTASYNYDMNGIWSSMTEAEQHLHNAKMFYSCAEFFKKHKKYYINKACEFYCIAMNGFKNTSDKVFLKNRVLICDLSLLLCKKRRTLRRLVFRLVKSLISDRK